MAGKKTGERKAKYTANPNDKSKDNPNTTQNATPNDNPNDAPFTLHPTLKIILTVIFTAYLVLSALKTFTPEIYQDIQPYLGKLDKIVPALNKPIGNYIVP